MSGSPSRSKKEAKRILWYYAGSLAALLVLLQILEYHFLILRHSTSIYLGCIALIFTGLGIWAGNIWSKQRYSKTLAPSQSTAIATYAATGEQLVSALGLSKRELEVLHLLSTGLSNQEIADKLYVSVSTVKTYNARLFSKLEVQRRTQAIQKGRLLGII